MRVFGRELDELEEPLVSLALVFLASTAIFALTYRALASLQTGSVSFAILVVLLLFAKLARGLSFVAGSVVLALWILRSLGRPLYERFRVPGNKIQGLFRR
jgi:hypothetical protein